VRDRAQVLSATTNIVPLLLLHQWSRWTGQDGLGAARLAVFRHCSGEFHSPLDGVSYWPRMGAYRATLFATRTQPPLWRERVFGRDAIVRRLPCQRVRGRRSWCRV